MEVIRFYYKSVVWAERVIVTFSENSKRVMILYMILLSLYLISLNHSIYSRFSSSSSSFFVYSHFFLPFSLFFVNKIKPCYFSFIGVYFGTFWIFIGRFGCCVGCANKSQEKRKKIFRQERKTVWSVWRLHSIC